MAPSSQGSGAAARQGRPSLGSEAGPTGPTGQQHPLRVVRLLGLLVSLVLMVLVLLVEWTLATRSTADATGLSRRPERGQVSPSGFCGERMGLWHSDRRSRRSPRRPPPRRSGPPRTPGIPGTRTGSPWP